MNLLLILHDDETTVIEDRISALTKAAGVKTFWPHLYRKALGNTDIGGLIYSAGVSGDAPAAAALDGGGSPVGSAVLAKEKKEEEKKDESEESENVMGFDTFD